MTNQVEKLFDEMKNALVQFNVEPLKEMIAKAIQMGVPAEDIIDVLSDGMDIVGEKYQAGEYFVTMLIIAGETMKEAMEVLEPHLKEQKGGEAGRVVLATVAGDIHDIGKNIFNTLATIAGFEVVDLGIDVSAEKIVDAVRKHKPNILGLSALLTTNLEQFPIVIEMLKRQGLRNKIKVIVGGATVTEDLAREAGVDAYTKTAVEGVEICKKWVGETDQ